MERTKIIYQFNWDDYFDRRLQHLHDRLKELAVVLDHQQQRPVYLSPNVTRQVVIERKPTVRKPALVFPFSLLAQTIDGCLHRLDRAVCLLVQSVIARWMSRLRLLLRGKRLA